MAAGAGALSGETALAVLHGARGLTNALGAVADVRRSELPVLCVVGLPARGAASYLPPHAEPDLITSASRFASLAVDCTELDSLVPGGFLRMLSRALQPVSGPALLGVPQDVATTRFVPRAALSHNDPPIPYPLPDLAAARAATARAARPVVLIDDYLLRAGESAERALGEFARTLGAPVFQVAYRRGPMLFQQARDHLIPTLHGAYDPGDPCQRQIIAQADLLITVEDRNMYPRVVGPLPLCPKITITSRPEASWKNGYLRAGDIVLEGDPGRILRALADEICPDLRTDTAPALDRPGHTAGSGSPSAKALVQALGDTLAHLERPVLIDDSQMLGGLVSRHFTLLPASVRVLASHGGFVGSGLAMAVGTASSSGPVLCLLGDQGFTNGAGALAAAGQLGAPLVAVVCNNGSSVSLRTQAEADGLDLGDLRTSLLGNNNRMNYAAIARGYGISARSMHWPGDTSDPDAIATAAQRVLATLTDAQASNRPFLLELITPDDPEFWAGVWNTNGFDSPG